MTNQEFGQTGCPKCGKPIIILTDTLEWEYTCFGSPGKQCLTCFKFEKKKDDGIDE